MGRHLKLPITNDSPDSWRVVLGFSGVAVASCILNGVFRTFHITLFLEVYKLPTTYFAFGHFLYAFWNTANDVLAGWLADKISAKTGQRAHLIQYAGVLWAISFLLPWFRGHTLLAWFHSASPSSSDDPDSQAALGAPDSWFAFFHFLMSLSLFDGFFSFVAIVRGALMADVTVDHHVRTWISFSSSLSTIVVSTLVVYVGSWVWDPTNLEPFRSLVVVLAVFSAVLFVAAAALLPRPAPRGPRLDAQGAEQDISVSRFVQSFLAHRNFHWFLVMNVLLEAEAVFLGQFLKTFIDCLSPFASHQMRGVFLACVPFLGKLGHLSLFPYVRQHGVYSVYQKAIAIKFVGAVVCLCVFRALPLVPAVFLMLASAVTNTALAYFDITISDIIDEHRYLSDHSEGASTAAMFWGTHALFAKPFNSLFPIIASFVLLPSSPAPMSPSSPSSPSQSRDFTSLVLDWVGLSASTPAAPSSSSTLLSPSPLPSTNADTETGSSVSEAQIRCLVLVIGVPLLVSVVQWFAWRNYSLRGRYLSAVKQSLHEQQRHNVDSNTLHTPQTPESLSAVSDPHTHHKHKHKHKLASSESEIVGSAVHPSRFPTDTDSDSHSDTDSDTDDNADERQRLKAHP